VLFIIIFGTLSFCFGISFHIFFLVFCLGLPFIFYTVSQKKTRYQTLGHNFTNYYPIFKIFFSSRLGSKFTTNSYLNIPPRFKHVATLPCEIWTQKKWHHSEIGIAINDESQGSTAKNLRCEKLLYYTFITHSAGERMFKIGEHLAKLRAKSLTMSYTPFALHFCPQRCISRQISWITCVLQTETVIKRCYVNRQINVS